MSVRVMSLIWERSQHRGGALLLMLALGDYSNDDGTNIFPSLANLAAKARLRRRQAQNIIRTLEASGELTVSYGTGRGHVNNFTLNLDKLKGANIAGVAIEDDSGNSLPEPERVQFSTVKGAISGHKGCSTLHPEPSIEPSIEPPEDIYVDTEEPEVIGTEQLPLTQDPETLPAIPDWYTGLHRLKGFKVSYGEVLSRMEEIGVTVEQAGQAANALLATNKRYKDYWRAFLSYCANQKKWDAARKPVNGRSTWDQGTAEDRASRYQAQADKEAGQ